MNHSGLPAVTTAQVADEAWIAKYRAAIDACPAHSSEKRLAKIAAAIKGKGRSHFTSFVRRIRRLILVAPPACKACGEIANAPVQPPGRVAAIANR